MSVFRLFPLAFLVLGYALMAVVGTRTQMVFQWPSYALIGLGAIAVIFLLNRRVKALPGVWCLVSMLLLTSYVIVRAALSPVSYFGRMEIAMVLAAAIIYILFAACYTRSRYRSIFIWLLLALALGNVVVGLYQVLRDPSFLVVSGYTRPEQVGASGFYRNHNHLGGFLLIGGAFAMAMAVFGKVGAKSRVVLLFMVPVCLGGIAMTASRGAILSIACCLLVFALVSLFLAKRLYEYEFKKILAIGVPLLAIGVIGTGIVGMKFLSKRAGVGSEGGEEVVDLARDSDGRFLMWSLAIDQWEEHPVFGQGSRMYDTYSMEHWPASRNKTHGDAEFAHNDYVQMLGEYGAVGIVLMFFFIVMHVGSGLRYLLFYRNDEFGEKRSRVSNSLAQCFGALLVLAAYAAHSVVDFNLHLPANLIPVAFAFAILANPTARSGFRRRSAPRPLVELTKWLMPVAGAALVFGGVVYGRGEWHFEKARRVPISNYGEVIAHTDESLKFDRGNFHTFRLRGTALLLFGLDFDIDTLRKDFMTRAISAFEEGLEVNPYDIFCLTGLGRCYDELDEPERAEEYFVRATTLGTRSREAHLRFGFHHINLALDMVEDDLVGAMLLIEKGELELQKAWQSNEQISRDDREYKELLRARRYQSHMFEEHGNRLAVAGLLLVEDGKLTEARAYIESALKYYSDARMGAPLRRDILNAKRREMFDHLKDLPLAE